MHYGVSIPNFGEYSEPRLLAELAHEAEAAGWEGFFLWDHIVWPWHATVADPWVALAAVAMRTEHLRLGPMVTPLPRRHPWKLARETVTLDHLSEGRLLLGVGLGGFPHEEFEAFGETGDDRVRAAKLDEGLEVLTGLWSGAPFSYHGTQYQVHNVHFTPPTRAAATHSHLGSRHLADQSPVPSGRTLGWGCPDQSGCEEVADPN